MTRRNILCTALLTLVMAIAARATTLARMNLDELAAAAEAVVHAQCLGNASRWEGGEIWTFTSFEVMETMKGAVPRLLTVRLLGGQVGHLVSTVSGVPRFVPGEEAILFLERTRVGDFSVTGWAVGTFRIHRDARSGKQRVTQESSSVAVFNPATLTFRAAGIRNLPLDEFRRRLAAAVERVRDGRQP